MNWCNKCQKQFVEKETYYYKKSSSSLGFNFCDTCFRDQIEKFPQQINEWEQINPSEEIDTHVCCCEYCGYIEQNNS